MKLEKLDGLNKKQLSMVEVAYEILKTTNEVHAFNDLLVKIQDYLEMSQETLENKMALFYTEMNADGSFISLGENRWGLREWYPVDSIDEEIISSIDDDEVKKKRRKTASTFAATEEDLIDYAADDPEDEDPLDDDEDFEEEEAEDDELEVYSNDLNDFDHDEDEEELEDGLEGNLTEIEDDEEVEDDDAF